MGKLINFIFGWFAIFALIISIIFGCYWIAKKVSYIVFYQNMVQETVREMVKKECLK